MYVGVGAASRAYICFWGSLGAGGGILSTYGIFLLWLLITRRDRELIMGLNEADDENSTVCAHT